MKRFLPLCSLFLLAAPLAADAQLPRQHSLSLEATATSAGGSTQTSVHNKTATDVPSATRTFSTNQTTTSTSKEAVQISVRNFSAQPDAAHVEWYFIAAPATLAPGKPLLEQEFAFDQGAKDLSLVGGATQTFPVESTEITASQKRATSNHMFHSGKMGKGKSKGRPTVTGDKPSGWIVRVVADGKVLATKASSTNLEEIAKDDARLKELADR